MTYRSSKTYGHEVGLSCCFRQWRAESHCNQLHGYALSVHLEFEADALDARNWVIDFGSLKALKKRIKDTFDHKTLVAADDPDLDHLCALSGLGIADVLVVGAVGCEAFAEIVYAMAQEWLVTNGHASRVRMHSVTIREHGANSATYTGHSA